MSFRLRRLGIYSRLDGELRSIDFNVRGLNIITGASRRGKSAIISILDYLLMSKHCTIPRGVIRKTVSHVAALFEREDGARLLAMREVPQQGHAGSQVIHVQQGIGIGLPLTPVQGRWNLASARDRISEFASIQALPLLSTSRTADEESFAAANIRHAVPLLFQPQDVIDSRVVSFPGLEDFWHKRHVLDALDYFLGVFDKTRLMMRRELTELENQHRYAQRRLAEARRLGAEGYARGQRLLAEVLAMGMAPDGEARSLPDIRRLLSGAVLQSEPTLENATASAVPSAVVEEERKARAEYFAIQGEINQLEAESQAADSYSTVVDAGIERISLRTLLPNQLESGCPVCGSNSLDVGDLEASLSAAADALGRERVVPERLHTKMEHRLHRLREREQEARTRLRAAQRNLRALWNYLAEQRSVLDEVRMRERLRGRIEAYLTATAELEDFDFSADEALLSRIQELRRVLAARDQIRRNAEDAAEREATRIASELDVEFQEPTRVNLSNLSIQVRFDSDWANLEELGSGANWVSYHVAGALSLSRLLAEREAPVPRFVMLDQPSQAWFPAEATRGKRQVPDKDADREAVRRLYQVLRQFADRDGSPQVIVMDHARIAEPWFEECVICDWHEDGKALVPDHWETP